MSNLPVSIPPLLRQETLGPEEFGPITTGTPVNGQSVPEFVPLPNGLWGWDRLMELQMDDGWYDSGDEYEHEDISDSESDSESDSGEDMEITDTEAESVETDGVVM